MKTKSYSHALIAGFATLCGVGISGTNRTGPILTPVQAHTVVRPVDPEDYYVGVDIRPAPPAHIPASGHGLLKDCAARVPGRTDIIPAFNFIATHDGKYIFHDNTAAVTKDTRLPLASISKLVSASAFHIAAEDARINFDLNGKLEARYQRNVKSPLMRFKGIDDAMEQFLQHSNNEAGRRIAIELGKQIAGDTDILPDMARPQPYKRDAVYYSYLMYKQAKRALDASTEASENRVGLEADYYRKATNYYTNIEMRKRGIAVAMVNVNGLPEYEEGSGGIELLRGAQKDTKLGSWGHRLSHENSATIEAVVKLTRLAETLDSGGARHMRTFKISNGDDIHIKTGTNCSIFSSAVGVVDAAGNVVGTFGNKNFIDRNANLKQVITLARNLHDDVQLTSGPARPQDIKVATTGGMQLSGR